MPLALVLVLVLALTSACAGRFRASGVPPTPQAQLWAPALGQHVAVFRSRFTGPVFASMTIDGIGDGKLSGATPPDRAWKMIGGLERVIGPLLGGVIFPEGRILTWETTLPAYVDGKPVAGEGSLGVGSLDALRVRTRTDTDGLTRILLRDGRVAGVMELLPIADGHVAPARDYGALVAGARERVQQHLYDPRLAQGSSYRGFFNDFAADAPSARDDLEFLLAGGAAARKHLRNAPPFMYPDGPDDASLALLSGDDAIRTIRLRFDEPSRVGVLRVDLFLDAREISQAIEQVRASRPSAIILDLRSCVGGDLSGLALAQPFLNEATPAGTFVASWKRAALREGGATASVTLTSPEDALAIDALLDERGLASLAVAPAPPAQTLDIPLIVLTTGRTSSTAEALVEVLRRGGRDVKIWGAKTAGRARLSRAYDAGQGWVVRFGAFDYLPPGEDPGSLARYRGVTPDRALGKEESLAEAVESLGASPALLEAKLPEMRPNDSAKESEKSRSAEGSDDEVAR
jgi:hypothetical protein